MTAQRRFIDCFSPLTDTEAKALKHSGYDGACRYLGAKTHPTWGKGCTPEELHNAVEAGLHVVFNWEGDSNHRGYFTSAQGAQDARDTLIELEWLGVKPSADIAVYFSVDYDAYTQADFDAVDAYMAAVEKELSGKFSYGLYGGLPILEYLSGDKSNAKPHYFWQTIAWSGGKLFPHRNLYQNRVNAKAAGVSVDVDQVLVNPGWYPVDPAKSPSPAPEHFNVIVGWFPSQEKAAAAAKDITLMHHWHAQVEKVN